MTKSEKIKQILRQDRPYTMQKAAFCFLPGNHLPEKTAGHCLLGTLQSYLKQFGRLYYWLLLVLGPVFGSSAFRHAVRQCLSEYGSAATIINLGSGPQYFNGRTDIINIDVFAFDEVDIVADATDLPLEDRSVDLIINVAMLEHVPDPAAIVREMRRILKPGGKLLAYAPFIVPYHAAPNDYYRWTGPGVSGLFSQFSHVETAIGSGPTSGLLYVLQEWLAIFFSFGWKPLHDILFLVFMVVLFPLKFIDFFLEKTTVASTIASGFVVVARNDSTTEG